jgi:hypothetical protein
MLRSMIATALIACAGPALAQSAAPNVAASDAPVPYSVAVETLALTKTKSGLANQTFSVGGHEFSSFIYEMTSSGLLGMSSKSKVQVNFKFAKSGEGAQIAAGSCKIKGSEKSLFGVTWDVKVSSLYGCEFKALPAPDVALEISVPSNAEAAVSMGPFSLSKENQDPANYANIKAKMTLAGALYEAVPTALDMKRGNGRAVQGYTINRDGKPIARIDFGAKAGDQSTLTAPVADADGRTAVLLLSGVLLVLPDPKSEMRGRL